LVSNTRCHVGVQSAFGMLVTCFASRTWKRDKGGDDVPANLYAVKFFDGGKQGFILGNDAVLLRYIA
jgi:photosystem II stability/assembly factor-like uncharacterized protein